MTSKALRLHLICLLLLTTAVFTACSAPAEETPPPPTGTPAPTQEGSHVSFQLEIVEAIQAMEEE